MAAVAKGPKVRPVTPPGYEFNDKCELAEAVTRGDLLEYTGAMSEDQPVMQLLAAGSDPADADGIALMDGYEGERGFSVGIQGEMDGFTGLTPGTALYPSATVAGGLDTTAIAGTHPTVKAVTTTRIRHNFV